ncbi:putative exocyst complex component Exo70, cullin repeat-like-containing domain-containing protein [Rosa chinensis]|uniref:Exocyst subunit Exo70 family protein n=1 Tax=Rosa chinensis TaxID=74649 RepID=A0A2P6P506_ROSCH|nr:exocyst complex component EXO70B1 [Rosa chinensis]XP_024172972.1 exocyst complex component EXO70B1 [Rosa chinensis]XP_024172973.1 exocyst complex component EXO70B1 [Rosa chinensis]XP_024172974.1 exocyst complex component EXO70B1 [Rosa chinensis]PRQ16996.1 putative exocyst complex component Exo70, cullin repeat-like-containing domain-containing protein [Rosa chinensis]
MTTTTTSIPAAAGGGGGEDRVLAAAQHIVKSLGNTPKEVREDMLLIFSSFDNRLSNLTSMISDESKADDDRFDAAEKVIFRWEANHDAMRSAVPWEESPNESAEYLLAVDEILGLMEGLSVGSDHEISDRAENAIQIAMSRLEDEFRHILIRNTVPLDSERLYGSIRRVSLSFASHDGDFAEEFESFGEVDRDAGRFHERGGSLGDDVCVDLIHPDAVVELKEIAYRMIRSGYEKECVQVYSSVRRDALDECLVILGVEKLSIEEVQKIEWKLLDEKMKKWIHAVKIGVRVLLFGERRLSDQIFEGTDETREICFNETTKGCIMQLLNFGEAVAIGKRSPEKLFRILDMYDVLADVYPDLEQMVGDEFVLAEAKGVLDGLGDAARGTFAEFENAVQGEASKKPMLSGEIHPISRYVMNYVRLLVDYSETLNLLLDTGDDELQSLPNDDLGIESMSPIGRRLLLLINNLESNLGEKSKVYEDGALQCVFMMNNIQYIVQKVKDSELRKLLGDNWVRKRRGQVRQYATGYLRAAWSKALSCLKDEGIGGSTSNASKMALKERFKNFNANFEDLYRTQTAWKVPDAQLREELRISISEKVIPAYRSFMGRFGNQLESGRHAGKYIKYTADDLESYVLDLFEGTPCVLHHLRRKST